MPSPTLTRRALVAGVGTTIASAALAVPYVNAARHQDLESITDRLDRITEELATAMREYQGGKFQVTVDPSGDVRLSVYEQSAEDRLRRATAEIRAAMHETGSTDYWVIIKPRDLAKAIDWAPDGSARREILLG